MSGAEGTGGWAGWRVGCQGEVERWVGVWNLVEMWTTGAPEAAGAWTVGSGA